MKSQRTPLVKRKIRKEPKALWPSCQSRPGCAGVNESQLQSLLWHRHFPGWLSHGTIRLVTHPSEGNTPLNQSHSTTFLFLQCHIKDASITTKLVSRDSDAQVHAGKPGALDDSRHQAKNPIKEKTSREKQSHLMVLILKLNSRVYVCS